MGGRRTERDRGESAPWMSCGHRACAHEDRSKSWLVDRSGDGARRDCRLNATTNQSSGLFGEPWAGSAKWRGRFGNHKDRGALESGSECGTRSCAASWGSVSPVGRLKPSNEPLGAFAFAAQNTSASEAQLTSLFGPNARERCLPVAVPREFPPSSCSQRFGVHRGAPRASCSTPGPWWALAGGSAVARIARTRTCQWNAWPDGFPVVANRLGAWRPGPRSRRSAGNRVSEPYGTALLTGNSNTLTSDSLIVYLNVR